jgi:hypothetical protein
MNLQFLTLNDYLMRNFALYQIESTTQIRYYDCLSLLSPCHSLRARQDIQNALRQVAPRQTLSGSISFGGRSRMATPLLSFRMEEVIKPDIGEVVPGRVTCSFQIDLSQYQGQIRDEWESLHQHDGG